MAVILCPLIVQSQLTHIFTKLLVISPWQIWHSDTIGNIPSKRNLPQYVTCHFYEDCGFFSFAPYFDFQI